MTETIAISNMGNFLTHLFHGIQIKQKAQDGFVDGTAMAKAGGRQINVYNRSKRAKQYKQALRKVLGMEEVSVVQQLGRGIPHVSWLHPLVAMDFASYLKPSFGILMAIWCARYISGDANLIADASARVDQVHGTKSILTHTMADETVPDECLITCHNENKTFKRKATFCSSTHISKKQSVINVSVTELIPQTEIIDTIWDMLQVDEPICQPKTVYFIRLKSSKMVKIGQTGDIVKRFRSLQSSNPYPLAIEFSFGTMDARTAELSLHAHFKSMGKHVRGEWFRLDTNTNFELHCRTAGVMFK